MVSQPITPGPPQRIPMPNIASLLKAEIARVARREVRVEIESLRKAATAQRSEIVALKRRMQELEKQLKALTRIAESGARGRAGATAEAESEGGSDGFRFRAEGMARNRKRLGLSAADFGLLVGATGQSVYAWEQGKSKPRSKALVAIAALRGIGKREVVKRLEMLKQAG